MSGRSSERGAVAPASLLAAAIVAVAIGAAGYALTSNPSQQAAQPAATRVTPSATPTPTQAARPTPPAPSPSATATPVDRTAYSVAIYNNSSVRGLAARTATKAQNVGWKVVSTAQWTGSLISSSTIYYPTSMQAAAQQLANDLGISTIKPAISPMQMDQLTVILTANYNG